MPPQPSPDGPRVQLTLGPCLFSGIFDCPCTKGTVVDTLISIAHNSQCENCGHALTLHQEVDEPTPHRQRQQRQQRQQLPWLKVEPSEVSLLASSEPPVSSYKAEPASSPGELHEQGPAAPVSTHDSRSLNGLPQPLQADPSRRRSCQSLNSEVLQETRSSFGNGVSTTNHPQNGPVEANGPFKRASDPLPRTHEASSNATEYPHDAELEATQNNPPYICPREETVTAIAKVVEHSGAVLIWGLPGSGKSTLGQLLFENLCKKGTQTVFINDPLAIKPGKIEESLIEICQSKYPGAGPEDVFNGDFVFIIDEAHRFMQKLKRLMKCAIHSKEGPKFCLLSDQGRFADRNSVFELLPEISHLASHGACTENIGIFYTKAEFENFVSETTSRKLGYRLSERAANHIFSLTAGNPSIVSSILYYIDMYHAGEPNSSRHGQLLSLERVVALLHDDNRLFQYLSDKMYPGTFARTSSIALRVFQKLLSSPRGMITWNAEYSTTGKCFEHGLICHEIDTNGADVFRFPSPLHERWARWYHLIPLPA